MFIIRMKNRSTEGADWVVMKTPIGNLFFAFANERDALWYLARTGAEAVCEAVSHEELLRRDAKALEGVETILLLPSQEAAARLLRDAGRFPYEAYVVARQKGL